jgi:hypothetical protein
MITRREFSLAMGVAGGRSHLSCRMFLDAAGRTPDQCGSCSATGSICRRAARKRIV